MAIIQSDVVLADGAVLNIESGEFVNSVSVNSGGRLNIFSSGSAIGTMVNSGGWVYVSSGGTATGILENGGYVDVANGADVSFASNTISRLYLYTSSATVHSGTTAVSTTIHSGTFFVYSSGIADDTTVSSGGKFYVNAGGIANNTLIDSYGSMFVSSGGTANGVTLGYGGGFFVSSCGTANATVVNSGGGFTVSANATANSTTVNTNGRVTINAGGTANSTTVNTNGRVTINDGGIANSTTVCSSGMLFVSSGGTANGATVRSGGSLTNNGKLAGRLTIQRGANVSATEDSLLDFDLSCVSAGNEPLVNGLSRLKGSPAYAITVSDSQAQGIYALADGAEQFGGTITVVGMAGEDLGTLAVGETVEIDGVSYTLFLTGGDLSLAVGCEPPPVSIFSGVVIQSNETRDVNAGEVYYSTTVSELGYLIVSSGGTADLASVSSGGYLQVSGGGIAKRISANGEVLVFSGGSMKEVGLRGGNLQVFGGATVNEVAMTGGSIQIVDSGTVNDVYGSLIRIGSVTNCAAVSVNKVEVFSGGTASDINDRIVFIANSAAYFNDGDRIEVYSGGTAHGAAVQKAIVSSGGTADCAMIGSGGCMVVSSGGIANYTTVNDSGGTNFRGGLLSILAGGIANYTTVSHGGVLLVSSGGTADNATVFDADIYVSSGGTANNVSVDPAGLLLVSCGGTASGIMENGGCVSVEDGADVSFAQNAFSGGIARYKNWHITVHSGTTAYGVSVEGEGAFNVYNGGIAHSTIVSGSNGKGEMNVGGTAFDTVVSSGSMIVSSGGTAFGTIVSGGSMIVSSGGTANGTVVTNHGTFYLDGPASSGTSGGTANNTVVNSYCSMFVANNGIANDTTLNDSGSLLKVNYGGMANNTTINGGSLQIFSGGTANDTTLNFGTLYISGYNEQDDFSYSGPRVSSIANNTTINRGRLEISGRCAAANSVLICSGGNFSVGYGAVANGVTVSSGGKLLVSSGGSLSGRMTFESRAVVSMFGGSFLDFDLTQTSAGAAALVNNFSLVTGSYFLTLTVDAELPKGIYLLAEGAAKFSTSNAISVRNATTQPGQSLGSLHVGDTVQIDNREYALSLSDGVLALSVSTISGGVISSGTVDIGDYEVYSGAAVRAHGRLFIYSGGTANSTTVNTYGYLNVFIGGIAVSTTVNSGGSVVVSSGGTAENIIVSSGGSLTVERGGFLRGKSYVLSGGVADGLSVDSGGTLYISKGATATGILENGGYLFWDEGADVTFGSNTFSGLYVSNGSYAIHSGTTAVSAMIGGNSTGSAVFHVSNGAMALSASVNRRGSMFVSSGGSANSTTVSSDGKFYVNAGGIANNTLIDSYGGKFYVNAGGIANNTLIDSYGSMFVSSGGTANSTNVNSGGRLSIFSGGTANGTTLSRCSLHVSDGVTVNSTTVNYDGELYVIGGGTANDTTVNDGGTMFISDRGTANDTTVNSGGRLRVLSGGTATGKMTFEEGAIVSMSEGGILNFDLTQAEAGDEALVNDLSIIQGAPLYTLTVDAEQEKGKYILAEGAAEFNSTISVVNAVGDKLGTLTLGETVRVGYDDYTLNLNEGALSVTIAAPDLTPQDPAGSADRVSWEATGAEQYIVEYSTDNFEHVIQIVTNENAVEMLELPAGTYQWRVKADGNGDWAVGEAIVSEVESTAPKVVQSNEDGKDDIFFATPDGTWSKLYYAQHVGSLNDWTGTNEVVSASGWGRIHNLFFGSSDPNVLCLTDGENGDAIFVDDVYTGLPEEIEEHMARLYKIQEVRAGAGNDIVDMTSQRFEYIGDGLTIRGGDGNDVIWTNKGDNFLFGDDGDDRIVGASGDDVLAGGIGNDSMHGGGGNDVFAFCDNWGADTVEQLETGTVTLWFASGDESNWNAETLTYTDGDDSVTVSGVSAEQVTLKFGDDSSEKFAVLSSMGAFDAFTSRKIFEANDSGNLASQ